VKVNFDERDLIFTIFVSSSLAAIFGIIEVILRGKLSLKCRFSSKLLISVSVKKKLLVFSPKGRLE
jgi:hypothetical protein